MTKVSEKDYKLYKSVERKTVSLNSFIDNDSETELEAMIRTDNCEDPVYEQAKDNITSESLKKALESLDNRERFIIIERYGLNDGNQKTLEEVGSEMGLTRERVRQLEKIAMKKLKNSSLVNAYAAAI